MPKLPQHVLDEDALILALTGAYQWNDLAVRYRVTAEEAKAMVERGAAIRAARAKAEARRLANARRRQARYAGSLQGIHDAAVAARRAVFDFYGGP